MQKNLTQKVHDSIKDHLRQKRWRRVVTAMACVVVFCTTYALILPAVTMTKDTYCGKETHTHSREDCYERVLVCELEENASEAKETVKQKIHTHTEECYETEEILVCEREEDEGHTHSEECYDAEGSLTCDLEASKGHTHGESCYQEERVLVCTESTDEAMDEGADASGESHVHTDACYGEKLVCQLEEHEHAKSCYVNPEENPESGVDLEDETDIEDDVVSVDRASGNNIPRSEDTLLVDTLSTPSNVLPEIALSGDGGSIEVDEEMTLRVEAGEIVKLSFVPAYTHEYVFYSSESEDSCGYLYDADGKQLAVDDHGGDGNHFEIIYTLTGGESYYWGAGWDDSEKEGDITVCLALGAHSYSAEDEGDPVCVCGAEAMLSVAAVNAASLSAASDYIGTINTANAWQIVAEQYVGNENTNKVGYDTDGDGVSDVLLQKNVVPTENENEFLVYLSVTKQMTWDELLAQSQLGLTTQGKWTDSDVGRLVNTSEIGGNKSNILQPGTGTRNYLATIYLTSGGTTVHTFTGWYNGTTPNASKCTGYIVLNGLSGKAIIASAKVNLRQDGSGTGGTLSYTIDLDTMTESGISYALNEIELNSVEDVLGEGMIYDDVVNCDGSVSESNGTLTWNIEENPDVEGVNYTNPVTGYLENVAQLVYRVKLDVTQEGFHSCADNMNSTKDAPESYAVNQYATLSYQMDTEAYSQTFPVPYVRGLLYNISFDKKSETGKSLSGAVFALYASDGTTPVKHSDGTDYTITTVAGETSRFTDLPCGTYVLKEISPPKNYTAKETSAWTIDLSYTTNAAQLRQDAVQPTNLRYAGSDTNGSWVIVNKRNAYTYQLRVVKTDDTGKKFLQNVPFTVTNPDGGEALSGTTDGNGTITFDAAFRPDIEYVLSETAAPDGYQMLPADIKFKVKDDAETETQTVELINSTELNDLVTLNLSEENDKSVLTIHVKNQSGYALPETGGPGTNLFTLCGLGLMTMTGALMYRYFIRWKRERRFA